MIYGIGIDIEEVSRMKAVISGRGRFLERFFSKEEYEMFEKKSFCAETVCGNFCAKEAFVKALGTGFRKIVLSDIEVLRDELGKPYYNFKGKLKDEIASKGYIVHLSLTHTKQTAAAVAIIEKQDGYRVEVPNTADYPAID